MKAAEEVGFGVTEDLVGDKITGFTVAQTISKNGVRTTAVRSYITPVADRKNLHVAINATVTKVNIVNNIVGKRATGVKVLLVRRRRVEFEPNPCQFRPVLRFRLLFVRRMERSVR